MKSYLLAAAVALTAGSAQAVPVQWAGNGHYYELVLTDAYFTFAEAAAAAASLTHMGMNGYLATITSAAEQDFLNSVNPNNATVWLGGSDAETEGVWKWVTGPETGDAFSYTNWAPFEPNNCCGGEDGLLGWWSGDGWNDIYDGQGRYGLMVEYSPAPVPLPAGIGLVLTGLAGFGVMRKRRKP